MELARKEGAGMSLANKRGSLIVLIKRWKAQGKPSNSLLPSVTIPYCIKELHFLVIVYLSYELFRTMAIAKKALETTPTPPGRTKRTHTHRKKRQLDWGLLLEKEPHIKGPLQLHLSQWLDWLEQNSAVHMLYIRNLSVTVLPTRLPEKRTKPFLTFTLTWPRICDKLNY